MTDPARRPRARAHDAFPLRTVAARTGLTPDLIRAWEKRYGVVAPIRGARGARLYSSADIAHLQLLARVVGVGRAIGDVAALSPAALEELVARHASDGKAAQHPRATSPADGLIDRVMERLAAFDDTAIARLLGDAVVGLGTGPFVHEVVGPLAYRIGEGWSEGKRSIAEEHLLTGALRNLLGGLVHSRAMPGHPIVLATPSGERHEIGLLSVALLASEAGMNVVYLGVDLPAEDIVTAAARSRAGVVGVSVVGADNRACAAREVESLERALPRSCELWLGGADAAAVASRIASFGGLVIDSLPAAETEVARIVARAAG